MFIASVMDGAMVWFRMTPCFSVVITGDQTEYKYYISLGAPLHDIPELSQECLDGNTTVCQYKHENTFERSIGTQAAKYYANGKCADRTLFSGK